LSNLRPPCGAIEPTSLKRDISWSLLLVVLAPKRRNVYVDDAVFFLIHTQREREREDESFQRFFFFFKGGIQSADEIVDDTRNFKVANLLMNLMCKIIKKKQSLNTFHSFPIPDAKWISISSVVGGS
jgi:hypothetical protein